MDFFFRQLWRILLPLLSGSDRCGELRAGDDYQDLKPLYVIFICNFDPFGQELYRYTFSMQCEERDFPLNDGVKRIFFNTQGTNVDKVSPVLLDFLGYLNDSTDTYMEHNPDEKVQEIHNRIKVLKKKLRIFRNVCKTNQKHIEVSRRMLTF